MANTPERGALIGPGTYADIKRVIERVGGMPYGNGGGSGKIPTDFGDPPQEPSPFRRGTFSLPWAKGSTKTVTDAISATTTYEAKNYFAGLTGSGTRACAIAKVGGEWILIAAEC